MFKKVPSERMIVAMGSKEHIHVTEESVTKGLKRLLNQSVAKKVVEATTKKL